MNRKRQFTRFCRGKESGAMGLDIALLVGTMCFVMATVTITLALNFRADADAQATSAGTVINKRVNTENRLFSSTTVCQVEVRNGSTMAWHNVSEEEYNSAKPGDAYPIELVRTGETQQSASAEPDATATQGTPSDN